MNNNTIPFLKRYALLLILFLPGCSDPVPLPPDKADYIGLWVASDRYISIFGNGRLEYKKKLSFGFQNRVQSNFAFEGNIIQTSMIISFTVDIPPYKEDEQWKMQMDGIEYIRTGKPVSYGMRNRWPKEIK